MKKYFLYICFIFNISCDYKANNHIVRRFSELDGFKIPPDFIVIKNEHIDSGSIDGDFAIEIDLKFDEKNYKDLSLNIRNTAYFNKTNYDSLFISKLKKESLVGIWSENNDGFEYHYLGNNYEPININVNNKLRILSYVFTHL